MVQATESRVELVPQYIGLRLSADEYLALPDDGFKYQVINGVVVMSPSPTPRHQKILFEIAGQLRDYLKAQPVAHVVPDVDVRFAPDLLYRPDFVVIRKERLARTGRRIEVVPDLIVEIVSPGSESMDERTKRADYERFGVTEYWIVSGEERVTARVLRLEGGKYREASAAETKGSGVLPGFVLDLEAVRRAAQD
jgi:Uma2 family endonuclease